LERHEKTNFITRHNEKLELNKIEDFVGVKEMKEVKKKYKRLSDILHP
jgi:hypothetical protein